MDAKVVHRNVGKRIPKENGRRTVVRRLGEKGYTSTMQNKLSKDDPSEKQAAARVTWCKKHKHRDPEGCKTYVQAVGDWKWFTWYPPEFQPR